jgi:hypothetical protein
MEEKNAVVKTRVLLLLIGVLAMSAAVSLTRATTLWATVATFDVRNGAGQQTVNFNIGDTVHFNWTANGVVNITLYADPDYVNSISSWNFSGSTGEVTWTPQTTGIYEVDFTGARSRLIAVGTFFVVPYVPFGPILSIGACVAALGIAVILRPRYKMQ